MFTIQTFYLKQQLLPVLANGAGQKLALPVDLVKFLLQQKVKLPNLYFLNHFKIFF